MTGEGYSEETVATLFMRRNKDQPYHIDYIFVAKEKIKDFSILDNEFWLKHSDHILLVIDL